MPVVQTLPALLSPPSNAFGLVQYLAQRIPGYDFSEYLRELNSAYIHVWEEITKLRNHYFTNQKTVTVAKGQNSFDLLFNADGGLSAPLSSRLYQIIRIRVQPPAGGLFQTSLATHFNDPDYLAVAANPASTPTQTGPYYYVMWGRGNLQWAMPLAIGTVLEITYTFWPIALTYQIAGTVSSTGSTVTGSGTAFTSLAQPDFQTALPTTQLQEEIQAEFICNSSQIYRVATITSDTALTTASTINPVLPSASAYVLATLPEIPREHIRVIAAIALRSMYSVAGDDSRVNEWTAIAAANLQMCKDALIERQGQNPPRKQRFPYGIARRNRAFLR